MISAYNAIIMDRFEALTAFAEVADSGGFSAAARRLRRTPSSITRTIAQLEAALGVQLFARSTRSVRLTDAGSRYLLRVRRILADLGDAERDVREMRERPGGRVSITASVQFGRLHVRPTISRYLAAFPDVSVNLHLDDGIVNLIEAGIDLAVRVGPLADSTLVARRVGWARRMLVASPAYVDRRGAPVVADDLHAHATVGIASESGLAEWRVGNGSDEVLLRLRPRLATNNIDSVLGHALDGGGIAYVLSYQVAEAIGSGALVELLPEMAKPPVPIHLVHPPTRAPTAAARALVEMIASDRNWDFTAV